ncbi:hypothetical protein J6590_004493 [Homalodisca vitripennis]|nr:hypothetical protein J6590_004493 [Homalodisca vitripennis]
MTHDIRSLRYGQYITQFSSLAIDKTGVTYIIRQHQTPVSPHSFVTAAMTHDIRSLRSLRYGQYITQFSSLAIDRKGGDVQYGNTRLQLVHIAQCQQP